MNWKAKFLNKKVEKDIENWPIKIKAKFTLIVELIEEFGPNEIGMPYISPFGKGLFEIRAKGLEGIGRAFFCILKGKHIIIVHGFIKKTQKTPKKEIELARKRIEVIKDE